MIEYLRFGLALAALVSAIIALYRTHKTSKMKNDTLDESRAKLDSQKTALKFSIVGIIFAVALLITRGGGG